MGPPRPLLLHSSHSSCRHRSRWRPLYWVAKVASAAAVSGGLAVERRTSAAVASRSSAGSTQGPSGAGSWSNGSRGLGPSGAVAGSTARRGGARACAGRVAAACTTACRRRTRCGRAGLHAAGGARRSGAGAEAGQTEEELQERPRRRWRERAGGGHGGGGNGSALLPLSLSLSLSESLPLSATSAPHVQNCRHFSAKPLKMSTGAKVARYYNLGCPLCPVS